MPLFGEAHFPGHSATPSQGITLTAHPYSSPPTGETDPQVPLTHVMLARSDTARRLATALLRHWLTSRYVLVFEGALVLAALAAAFPFQAPDTALVLLGMAVLMPGLLAVSCRRGARAMAPAGFTLGLGLGPSHLAVRHAVATIVLPYSTWKSATRVGEVVLLQTRLGGVVPLPVELFGSDLDRVRSLVGGAEDVLAPPAGTPLPYEFVCTAATRGQMFRGLLRGYARRPLVIVGLVLVAVVVLTTLLTRDTPPTVSVLALGLLPAIVALQLVTTWRRLAACTSPGMPVRAGLLDDALVVEDATGRATIPFRGVARVVVTPHTVLIRSTLRSSIGFPRALLPDAELARVQSAVNWYRSRR